MKRRMFSAMLAFVVLLLLSASGALAADLTIRNLNDLKAFAASVNGGNTYEGKTVELAANITLSDAWNPIGNGKRNDAGYTGNAFKGTFDGKGHTISGLKNPSGLTKYDAFGLFGVVDGGTIKNLTLTGVNVNDSTCANVGAAAGLMVGGAVADNIKVSGSLTAPDGVGGVVGRMTISGSISNCENNAVVTATSGAAGGIVGKAYYTAPGKEMNIENCTNTNEIKGTYAAGIAGLSAANVKNCVNKATITGTDSAGGIVAWQQSYGEVIGNANNALIQNAGSGGSAYGGIIGWVRYSTDGYDVIETIVVKKNLNTGNVIAKDGGNSSGGSGGVIGLLYEYGIVEDNVNKAKKIEAGTHDSQDHFAGGIVGHYHINGTPGNVGDIQIKNNVSTTPDSGLIGTEKNQYVEDSSRNDVQLGKNEEQTETQKVTIDIGSSDAKIVVRDVFGNVVEPQADGTYDLEDSRYTIEVSKDGKTAEVPFEVDGEEQDITLDVEQILPKDPPASGVNMPSTGDESVLAAWVLLAAFSGIGMTLMRKKRMN